MRRFILLLCVFAASFPCFAQMGIFEWRTHTPGMKVISVDVMHDKIFAATPYEVFYYNTNDNSINKLSKVNGLSDFGINVIRYNPKMDLIFVGYTNTNIDLIDNEGNIFNISDIKDKSGLGKKIINDVYFIDQYAYVCCGFGIVVIDLSRKEVKDTYIIGEGGSYLNVNDITVFNNNLYAATANGIYYASLESANLADPSQWIQDSTVYYDLNYSEIEAFNDKLFANCSVVNNSGTLSDTLFVFDGIEWVYFNNNNSICREIRAYKDRLLILNSNSVKVFDTNYNQIFHFDNSPEQQFLPFSACYDKTRDLYWIGDKVKSLVKINNKKDYENIRFDGPFSDKVFEIKAKGNQVWVASGGYKSDWSKLWSKDGIFYYTDNQWHFLNNWNINAMDTISDIVCLAIDPLNESKVYAGSFHKGILEFTNKKLTNIYGPANSSLGYVVGWPEMVYISGMDFDSDNNLWIANSGADKMLSVRTTTTSNNWFSYNIGNGDISHLMVDDNNYKWILKREGTLIVFNDNNTLASTADDKYKIISKTTGQGGLPDIANCMAVDKNGTVWVGTNDGLGLFYNTNKIFENNVDYDASKILVPRNDGSGQADYLLSGESVLSIAVDDANNLWFGTNNGVFYISNDGLTEYYHFTQENSPLLSNIVKNIAIDDEGNVYFATDKGIISFRSAASSGKTTNSDVVVYPNPVRPDFSGYVGIKNLVPNTLVKITTVDGSFVTHLKSEGGQAVWDCTTIDGKKVSPGIYLIFVSDKTGKESYATKILIMKR